MSEELKGELQSVKVRLLDAQDTATFLRAELQSRDNILNDLIKYANIKFEQNENVSLEEVHRALIEVIQPLPVVDGDRGYDPSNTASVNGIVDAEIVE